MWWSLGAGTPHADKDTDVLRREKSQRTKHHRSAMFGCNLSDVIIFALVVPIVGGLEPERPTHLATRFLMKYRSVLPHTRICW
jgi:hypothetical protein